MNPEYVVAQWEIMLSRPDRKMLHEAGIDPDTDVAAVVVEDAED